MTKLEIVMCKTCKAPRQDTDLFEGECRDCVRKSKPTMPLGNRVRLAEQFGDRVKLAEIKRERDRVAFAHGGNTPPPRIQRKVEKMTVDKFAQNYIDRKILKTSIKRPMEVNYKNVAQLYWKYYTTLIWRSCDKTIEPKDMDAERIKFIQNMILWMLGDESRVDDYGKTHTADFDPKKSLYIYGPTNVGKTTIALAAHHVMESIGKSTKWYQRHFKFGSMNEIFFETYTKESLKDMGKLGKNAWCIDDILEKHFSINHFGSELKLVNDIIWIRHNLWERNGTNTILTSNIPPKALRELVNDKRVWRRIELQYQFVKIIGK